VWSYAPIWIAPSRNRHYFPTTGEVPDVGRDEDLSATGAQPEPAESFVREWTNAPAIRRVPLPERPLNRATLLIAAVPGFAAAAQAQVYTQASLAPGQPYAIEVAPGTYMIQHAGSARAYPYVGCGRDCAPVAEPRSSAGRASPRRARTHNDPALIDECAASMRRRAMARSSTRRRSCAKSRSY
jgi:hypothetical protein